MHPCAPINILQSPSSWQRLDFSFSSKMHEEAVSAYSYFTKSNAKCGLGNVDARTRNKKTSRWGVAVDISSLSKRANAHFLLSSWFTQCQTSRKKKQSRTSVSHRILFASTSPTHTETHKKHWPMRDEQLRCNIQTLRHIQKDRTTILQTFIAPQVYERK